MSFFGNLTLASLLLFACNPFGNSHFSDLHLKKVKEDSNIEIIEFIQFKLNSTSIIKGTSTGFNVKLISNSEEKDITSEVVLSFANKKASKSGSNSILGLESGTVEITAKYNELKHVQTLTIVQEEVTSLTITPSTITLNASETSSLKANASYNNGTSIDVSSSVVWSSSNPSVAT